jgi:hypothetical protein
MKNATEKIPRLRLGMTHSVISNECERSFFSSIFEGVIHELAPTENENAVTTSQLVTPGLERSLLTISGASVSSV